MESPQDRIALFSRTLLSDSADHPAKVEILRALIQPPQDPRKRGLLRTAAGHPGNGPILRNIVRAFGLLHDRAALEDLVPFFGHDNKSVVCNALKAALDLDRPRAVQLASTRADRGPGSTESFTLEAPLVPDDAHRNYWVRSLF
jgi:hypothetical protein